jgi:tetratricopeptide (TPR) repeat protein
LHEARKRVLGKNHPATAGAFLGIGSISNSHSQGFHSAASRILHTVLAIRKTVLGVDDILTKNALRELARVPFNCTNREGDIAAGTQVTMLKWRQRYLNQTVQALGLSADQSQDALISLTAVYVCFGMLNSTGLPLQQMDPQSMSEDTLVKYLKLLDDLVKYYSASNDADQALDYLLLAIETSEKHLGEHRVVAYCKYKELGDYLLGTENRRAQELYYEAVTQSGIQSQTARVLKVKFLTVMERCIRKESRQDGKPMEYLNSTLNSLTDHNWFKGLLLFLNGELKLLMGQHAEAYAYLKLASDWVKENTDNSNGHRVGFWPVCCTFEFARSHFALGTVLFEIGNEEEAIKKGFDALELCEQTETCSQDFLWFKFEVLKVLLLWQTSRADQVAVLATSLVKSVGMVIIFKIHGGLIYGMRRRANGTNWELGTTGERT